MVSVKVLGPFDVVSGGTAQVGSAVLALSPTTTAKMQPFGKLHRQYILMMY